MDLENSLISMAIDFSRTNPATVGAVARAAYNGDIDLLKDLIKKKKSLRTKDNQGRIPLHYAAYKGNFDCLLMLLKAGPDEVNAQCYNNFTALDLACKSSVSPEIQYDIIAALFQAGATVDTERDLYTCSINILIECGNLPAIHLFLDMGANINQCDSNYGTPLHASVIKNQMRILRYLLSCGAKDEPLNSHFGFWALHSAIVYVNEDNRLEVLTELLSHHVFCKNINKSDSKRNYTALNMACLAGYYDEINLLLKTGACVNICNTNHSPLINLFGSLRDRNLEPFQRNCLKRIFELTSDDSLVKESNSLLFYAIWGNHLQILSKLIDLGCISGKYLMCCKELADQHPINGVLSNIQMLTYPENTWLDPLGLALYFSDEDPDQRQIMIKMLCDAGSSMVKVREEEGINIVPPFIAFTLRSNKLFSSEQEMKLLNDILEQSPDLSWNCHKETPIPDIYLAPLYTGNLSAFVILLQWGIHAEYIFTREKCEHLVKHIACSSKKSSVLPGWYVKILNEFLPVLPAIIIDIYKDILDFDTIEDELATYIRKPKSLIQLSVLAVRKQLYSAKKVPLKISIDALCQGGSYRIRNQLLCNDIIEWFPKID